MNRMQVMVIDVGGSHVKLHRPGSKLPVRVPSGPKMTAKQMVAAVKQVAAKWTYSVVSIGYPGVVVHGRPVQEPWHLGL